MKLYELSEDLVALRDMEEIEDVKAIKAIVEQEIANKGEGIIKVIRSIESDVDSIKAEIDRLSKIKKVKDNNIKKLRDYTKGCMENMEVKKLMTPIGNITLRKGTSIIQIVDEDILPEQYIEVVEVRKINKDAIKEDLKNGVVIGGVRMTEPGITLMIK